MNRGCLVLAGMEGTTPRLFIGRIGFQHHVPLRGIFQRVRGWLLANGSVKNSWSWTPKVSFWLVAKTNDGERA